MNAHEPSLMNASKFEPCLHLEERPLLPAWSLPGTPVSVTRTSTYLLRKSKKVAFAPIASRESTTHKISFHLPRKDDSLLDTTSEEWQTQQAARELLIGSTPCSPLCRESKAACLLPSFQQLVEEKFQRTQAASLRGIESRREQSDSLGAPSHSTTAKGVKVSAEKLPIVGQRYIVVPPWITLRANADVHAFNRIICTVKRGSAVRILRYVVLASDKLRVQVLTEDDQLGWATMIAETGEELLKLAPEEV